MHIRDRIKEFRRIRAADLRPHPRNWRKHPQAQQDAMRGVLAEIGFADALLARELSDGTLQLVDGHLRAELSPDAQVPVLVLDISEDEALKLLATLDPLAAMAETDGRVLEALAADIETDNAALRTMLNELIADAPELDHDEHVPLDDVIVPAIFQVVVECQDEGEQRMLYERMKAEGYKCRVLSL